MSARVEGLRRELLELIPAAERFVARLMGQRQWIDPEDIVLAAYAQAYLAIPGFDGGSGLKTWFFRIAKNHFINEAKSERRYRRRVASLEEISASQDRLVEFGLSQKDDLAERYETEVKSKEERERLLILVGQLKPNHRTVIVLRYYLELSYKEVALYLNAPLGTVKARMFRARQELRELERSREHTPHP